MGIVEAKGIAKIYNEGKSSEVNALCGVDVNIDEGEWVSIILWNSVRLCIFFLAVLAASINIPAITQPRSFAYASSRSCCASKESPFIFCSSPDTRM